MLLDLLQSRFESVETCSHAWQQFQALFGHFHVSPVTPEERHLQVVLERFDLLTDGSRRHIERICCTTETRVRRNGVEYPQ